VTETLSRAGDPLGQLYEQRHAPMVRLAHLLTGSNAVAQDIVHDAFLKVAPHLDRLDNPSAYLRLAVVNESRQWFRHRTVEDRHARAERPGEVMVLPPELDEMWEALGVLSDRQRTVVVLRFYEDLSIRQIAEVTSWRPGTVKSHLHRALRVLREQLKGTEAR
jgi:RNA polymerase sigma factor (sigma-70 family)